MPVCMEHLPLDSRESPACRDYKMNLLGPLGHRQAVVAHGGLTGEKPTVDARQDNGTLSTWDTDNPVLIGDELTGPHERGDVTALGASQLEVPYAYRSVAAAHSGEQLSVHGVHGAHCRPLAGRAQPGAGALWTTGASVNLWPPGPDMSPPSETSRPGSPSIVSKSVTKEPSHLSPSNTNRGITRFRQAHSAPATAFVTDLDTPHRSKALCTSGTAWEVAFASITAAALTQIRAGRPTLTCRPGLLVDRHSFVGLARHELTGWLDRPGESARTVWFHEHRNFSSPSSPAAITAGQNRLSHPDVTRPPPPLGLRGPGGLPGSGGLRRRAAHTEGRHLLHHR